jgi:hypothetical protein
MIKDSEKLPQEGEGKGRQDKNKDLILKLVFGWPTEMGKQRTMLIDWKRHEAKMISNRHFNFLFLF